MTINDYTYNNRFAEMIWIEDYSRSLKGKKNSIQIYFLQHKAIVKAKRN